MKNTANTKKTTTTQTSIYRSQTKETPMKFGERVSQFLSYLGLDLAEQHYFLFNKNIDSKIYGRAVTEKNLAELIDFAGLGHGSWSDGIRTMALYLLFVHFNKKNEEDIASPLSAYKSFSSFYSSRTGDELEPSVSPNLFPEGTLLRTEQLLEYGLPEDLSKAKQDERILVLKYPFVRNLTDNRVKVLTFLYKATTGSIKKPKEVKAPKEETRKDLYVFLHRTRNVCYFYGGNPDNAWYALKQAIFRNYTHKSPLRRLKVEELINKENLRMHSADEIAALEVLKKDLGANPKVKHAIRALELQAHRRLNYGTLRKEWALLMQGSGLTEREIAEYIQKEIKADASVARVLNVK